MDDTDRSKSAGLPSWYDLERLGGEGGSVDLQGEAATLYRNLIEAFVEGLPAGLGVIDSENGALVYVNTALAQILGSDRDAVQGTFYLDHVAPEDRERIRDYHRRRILGDPTLPPRYEMLLTRETGERRAVDLFVGPVRFSDALVVHMRDITEEKLYHEPLVHLRKMEGISSLMGRIAHEFNNLLASVLGHSSLLRQRLDADPDAGALVQRIESSTQRALEVLGQLLELSGARGSFFDRISGPALVERLHQVVEGVWESESVRVSVEISDEPWPIRGDLNLLSQAILELIRNAVDALNGKGGVRITLQNQDLSELTDAPAGAPAGEVVRISVEDDGPGIPDDLRGRVLEPYFTTHGETSHDGLGLTKVFRTAQEFDGHLEVGMSSSGGARLTLYIPRGPDPSANLPAVVEADSTADGDRPLVLVVDDQDYIGEMIEQMLDRHGIEVQSMQEPAVALAAIEACDVAPKLLILDVRMPGMDGRELALKVRESFPDLPIVMTSGYTGVTTMDEEVAGVLSGFLKKPFTVDVLLDMVLPLLGRAP